MKTQSSIRAASSLASLVTGIMLLVAPSFAQDANGTANTTATAMPATSASATPSAPKRKEVEDRVAQLHDQLKITPAQEDAWSKVAQVMRDNAAAMRTAIENRDGHASMTALEDMKSYQSLTQAHADGLNRLVDAFTPLYNAMTPAQQKNADQVFSRHVEKKAKH